MTTIDDSLFSGKALPFGGLSNEKELARACPEEFRKGSRWTRYAGLFASGEKKPALGWASNDQAQRERHWKHFMALMGGCTLSFEDKIAVGGWMLSVIAVDLSNTN